VKVSLNQGRASIALRPGNAITLDQATQVVKDKGFTPREARVSARGELVETGARLQFKLLNTNQVYDVVDAQAAKSRSEVQENIGKPLILEGIIPLPTGKTPSPMQLHDFRPIP